MRGITSPTTRRGHAPIAGVRTAWPASPTTSKDGRRPVYGGTRKFQEDPHCRDCLQFFEYFHGENGAGLGANHQTGWTGAIARATHLFATMKPEAYLEGGTKAYFETQAKPAAAVPAGTP